MSTIPLAGRLAVVLFAALLGGSASGQDAQAVAPARLQIVQNVPDPALPAADVYVNEVRGPGLDDLPFLSATPYVEVEPGRVVSVVVAADTSTGVAGALALGAFVAESGVDYQAVIDGVADRFARGPDGQRTSVAVRVVRRGAPGITILAGGGRIRLAFHHGSPDTPAYRYDAYSYTGAGVFGFTAPYGSTVEVDYPGADVHYRASVPGHPRVDLHHERLDVHAGESALVMLSGFSDPGAAGGGPGLGFYVVRESGAVDPVDGFGVATDPAPPSADAGGAGVVSVAPNPARGAVALDVPGWRAPAAARLDVTDVQGRRVWTGSAVVGAGRPARVSVAGLPPGVYLVRVVADGGAVAQGRMVVVR